MKVAKKILAVLFIAVAMELFIFNFKPVSDRIAGKANLNETYTLADFEPMNWIETEDGLITEFDPMLILEGIDADVTSLRISADCLKQVPYVNLFYTNDRYLEFGDGPVILQMVENDGAETIEIKDAIKNLRIDLGDEAGVALHHMTVVVNPSALQISAARIVAIVLIAFGAEFLLSLQKHPTYFPNSPESLFKPEADGDTGAQV